MAEITVKQAEGCKAAIIKGQGPYDKVGPLFEELFEWLKKKGIEPSGPSFGIYYDDPEKTPPEKCRYEIGFPIDKDIEGDERVEIKTYSPVEVATILHQGPYSTIGEKWGEICQWVEREGYEWAGPGREVYIKCPGTVSSEQELLTEIQIPIRKA